MNYNWTTEAYLATESLSLASLSGSLDGQTILVSGVDSFACLGGIVQVSTQKLVRLSDSKVITWVLARKTGELAWTEVSTNPCALIDNSIDGIPRQYDATAVRGEFVGFDGEYAVIAMESFVTGDRELRLARFKIDWDAGTISDVTIREVSANPRT